MNVLVTGGAGYIGSHAVMALAEAGHTPIVLDSLEKGHPESVAEAELIHGNVMDHDLVSRVCQQFNIDAVMHFAAFIEVGESMAEPMKYFSNNTMAVMSLLKTIQENGVNIFIFSSTAAVYGQPQHVPITESEPKQPINVYGHSKLMVEQACEWLSRLTDFRYSALRYFNACGAHPSGRIGEAHKPESHLRGRLRYAGRDLHQGLYPCLGSRVGSRQSYGIPRQWRGIGSIQPWYRQRLFGEGNYRLRPQGNRSRYSIRHYAPSARRPGSSGRRSRQGAENAWLESDHVRY